MLKMDLYVIKEKNIFNFGIFNIFSVINHIDDHFMAWYKCNEIFCVETYVQETWIPDLISILNIAVEFHIILKDFLIYSKEVCATHSIIVL
jgi:hypothetical protein